MLWEAMNKETSKLMYMEKNAVMGEKLLRDSLDAYLPHLLKIIAEGVQSNQFTLQHPIETGEIMVLVISSYCRIYVSTEDPSRLERIRVTLKHLLESIICDLPDHG